MTSPPQNLKLFDLNPLADSRAAEVLAGLSARRKKLPTSLLYDERGSELFEQICEQDEYYLTRTELSILHKYAPDIAKFLGSAPFIFEFGCGNTQKVRTLLEHLGDCSYMAIDISKDILFRSAESLARDYPRVNVYAVCADFHAKAPFPAEYRDPGRKVFFFPGSTIGNMEPVAAQHLLREIRSAVGPNGAAIVGVDLKKKVELVEAAYNDASGVTSRFELNALERLNKEFDANFDLSAFRYLGTYNQRQGRVEMYVVSNRNQTVRVANREFSFKKGETIHLEDSYKYSLEGFHELAKKSGFQTTLSWLDRKSWFAINLLLP